MNKELSNPNVELSVNEVETFVSVLNSPPKKEEIRINSMAGNSMYLPISFIEMKLDELFFGLWQTRNFTSSVVVNEIIGQIELGVFHPSLKEWIWRTGAASVMIQQKKGSNITDVGSKHKNTLVKDYPHLKAECMKNAARSLGKAFGRDLNREYRDEYFPMTTQLAIIKGKKTAIIDDINKAKTKKELTEIYLKNKSVPGVSEAIKTRRKQIQ